MKKLQSIATTYMQKTGFGEPDDKKILEQQNATYPLPQNSDFTSSKNSSVELVVNSNHAKILDDLLQPMRGNSYLPSST